MKVVYATRPNPTDGDWVRQLYVTSCQDDVLVIDAELGLKQTLPKLPVESVVWNIPAVETILSMLRLEQRRVNGIVNWLHNGGNEILSSLLQGYSPEGEALLEVYVLLRSKLVVCGIDHETLARPVPQMMIARMLGIPVIGVGLTTAYEAWPVICANQICRSTDVVKIVNAALFEKPEASSATKSSSTEGSSIRSEESGSPDIR